MYFLYELFAFICLYVVRLWEETSAHTGRTQQYNTLTNHENGENFTPLTLTQSKLNLQLKYTDMKQWYYIAVQPDLREY